MIYYNGLWHYVRSVKNKYISFNYIIDPILTKLWGGGISHAIYGLWVGL